MTADSLRGIEGSIIFASRPTPDFTMTDPSQAPPPAEPFEALLAPLLDRAYALAYHLSRSRDDAEDLVQEAALQAFRAFHQFRPGTNFRAWYLHILTNCFFAQYRKRKREPRTLNIEDAEPLYLYSRTRELGMHEKTPDPASAVLGKLGEDQVHAAIQALPEEYRVVCALYFVEELAYQEIAGVLRCPVGTVRSRLHRGRKLLQKELWAAAREHGIVTAKAAPERVE